MPTEAEILKSWERSSDIWRVHFMLNLIVGHGFSYEVAHDAYRDEENISYDLEPEDAADLYARKVAPNVKLRGATDDD